MVSDIERELRAEVGKLVRISRSRLGLTQEFLARKAGISTGYLNRIENERMNPSLETLVKIMAAMNLKLVFGFKER